MTVMEEMTQLILARPGPLATNDEVAAWYGRKARLLARIAEAGGPDAEQTRRLAELAEERSQSLRLAG